MHWSEIILFALAAVLAGFARGIHEGMIMVMPFDRLSIANTPGVRNHRWFEHYHIVSVARSLAVAVVGALLCAWWRSLIILPLVGSLFLLWESTEIGYAVARDGKMIYTAHDAPHEHIDFADIVSIDVAETIVYLLHAARVVVGITLIITGEMT